ncbi:MAG: aminopeptidase [archaeon]|nr:aminopeptidase [archaeon]MCR4323429.1 aminopeptidase [Nanoarchaeota archaeon]
MSVQETQVLSFDEKLRNYVELIVRRGLNVQEGEFVVVAFEESDVRLAEMASEVAYKLGARNVDHRFGSEMLTAIQLRHAPEQDRNLVHTWRRIQMERVIETQGCFLGFRSQNHPDVFKGLEEEMQAYTTTTMTLLNRWREEGINRRMVAWCLAGPPSPGWAAKVFPDLPTDEAVAALWDDVFSFTFADSPNCLKLWDAHVDTLMDVTARLNAMRITNLHYAGEGTDFTVGFHPKHEWISAKKDTAKGKMVTLNIPTFETFTTPDLRTANGVLRCTRPSIVHGNKVENLVLYFKEGKLVKIEGNNLDSYEKMVDTDEGARFLGEVALVAVKRSPIFQTGRVYQHTLYDENASCHVATGMAYATALRGGDKMGNKEKKEVGCNMSNTHHDVMVSDMDTIITATLQDGREVVIMENGDWTKDLLEFPLT